MRDVDFGQVTIHLKEIMQEQNISINRLAFRAELQRSQIRAYLDGSIQRLDISILARLCYALDCSLNDLLEYIPPKEL